MDDKLLRFLDDYSSITSIPPHIAALSLNNAVIPSTKITTAKSIWEIQENRISKLKADLKERANQLKEMEFLATRQ